jgi:hypothetical protein
MAIDVTRRAARRVFVVLGFLVLTAAVRPVHAQEVVTSVSDKQMESILASLDLTFTKKSERSWRVELNGKKALLIMASDHTDAQLYIAFGDIQVSTSKMNDWNTDHRFGRAYADSDRNPVLEADLDFAGGVTDGTIKAWINLFSVQITSYQKFLSE